MQGWHFTPPAAPLIVGAILMLVIAEVVRRRGSIRGARVFRTVCYAVAVYVVGYALELGASSPESVLWCLKLEYLGVAALPALTLITALILTGRSAYVTPLSTAMLLVVPGITWLLVLTNEQHQLVWQAIELDTSLGFTRTTFVRGPWYSVHNTIYTQMLLLLTIFVLWDAWRSATGIFRRQHAVLLVAMLIPIVVHSVYLATPWFRGLDPNPYALLLTAITLAWGMLDSALIDLVPEAHERVFASLADPVVVSDNRNRVVGLNPAAERALGVAAENVVGRDMAEALPVLEREPTSTLEIGDRQFERTITPLSSHGGRVSGRLVLLRDVTDRRQVERLREDLVNTLVHDLRNPLTIVRASTDLLAIDDKASPRVRELVEPARLATRRLLDLVSRLLEVHTLQSGRLPLERAHVHTEALIAEAVEMQAPLARAKDQTLVAEVEPALPPLFVDRELLSRVLQNLIGNAIKFTGAGTIRVTAQAVPGSLVEVSVQDAGPGIPQELQQRLFREFARGSQPGRGTGLGLAFCHSAILAHGGTIAADSDPARGTTVSFRLPVRPPTGTDSDSRGAGRSSP